MSPASPTATRPIAPMVTSSSGAAVAKAMGEEYKAVVDSGLNVQVDDAFIPFMYDIMVPPGTKEDWLAWGQAQIDSVNLALDGLPKEKVRYHVCWGSWNGPKTPSRPWSRPRGWTHSAT